MKKLVLTGLPTRDFGPRIGNFGLWTLGLGLAACLWGPGPTTLTGAESATNALTVIGGASAGVAGAGSAVMAAGPKGQTFHFQVLEPGPFGHQPKPVTWLGLATEEASEVLTSQLRLDPGVGLVVTYVAPDSPAARAGLQKNDVLVEFDGQALVHPAQLRKLVQVRHEGDTVRLAYYRAGKKEAASAALAKTTERAGWFDPEGWGGAAQGYLGFPDRLREQYGDALREEVKNLQRSLGNLHIDQEQVQREIRRSVEQARQAAAAALRHASNEFKQFGPTAKALENLARGWVGINKDATVTVNSSDRSVQTTVKADDSGTYVIVANPDKHLTVHDPSGKLLFDGVIETPAQQAKVPREIWRKVEPMVTRPGAATPEPPEPEPEPDL